MKAYPKIFSIGTDYIKDIFLDEVEITEKIDGSQFVFGKVDSQTSYRSKGAVIYSSNPDKMFANGVEYIESIKDGLPDNIIFYAEYLGKPKHNTLSYSRIPKNHLILFGAMTMGESFLPDFSNYAKDLNMESVPIIYRGKIENPEQLLSFLEKESVLGGTNLEGVVVKNYHRPFLLGGQPIPIMAGKFVSEKFKEIHRERWNTENTSKGQYALFLESFRMEARWEKAVQHLGEGGLLENSPRDIGDLIKEIHRDISEEEKENIKEYLWNLHHKEIHRSSTYKFAEWYKERLLTNSFKTDA